jgi:tRNA threonylcarbamoyladenosine biosynthesis protein TsaE
MNKGFQTHSAEDTEAFGQRLGNLLKQQGGPVVVCLFGDLGSGKTTFIKGFASAFGIPGRDIGSASYVIVAEYETTPPFYHMDLYRLWGEPCAEDMGLWEYIESDAVVVIEWAERLGELPEGAIVIRIKNLDDDKREFVVEGIGVELEKALSEGMGS